MEDRAARGKRLLMYGMVALVLVTIVSVYVAAWVITAPLGAEFTSVAWKTTLIVGVIAIVASAVVWFVYTKAILKE